MISAYIDRFEGKKAVLLLGDSLDKVIIPAKYLPEDANEGDYISIEMAVDEAANAAAEAEYEKLSR